MQIIEVPMTALQEAPSAERIYYFFEVEPGSPLEKALALVVGTEFQRRGDVDGLHNWDAVQEETIGGALAEIAATFGVQLAGGTKR